MKLVIVESPTKAKTIGRFLGNGYQIRASMGHIMDLPKSTLGVDVSNNFTPQFEISTDKKKTITELKKLAKEADGIILATDPDREGEAIAAHIESVLANSKSQETNSNKFSRIVFHEITKEAIEEALEHPGKVNTNLVDAQIARRVLDRLVGYKLSPLLWQKVRRGLSAGRVQSVALRLIVEREREIEKFKSEEYYTILVDLSQNGKKSSTEFELIEINKEKIEQQQKFNLYDGGYTVTKTTIDSQIKAENIKKDLGTKVYKVLDVTKKETKRSPQPPFTTSTLQQQASQRFGYSGKRTMSLAQKLYEEGYITYHRTDSVNLAQAAIFAMRDYVQKTFGEKYVPASPRFYSAKQKLAQEAHEAIRPTKIQVDSERIVQDLGKDYARLYDMIWKRAVASQMSDALIESTTILVEAKNGSLLIVDSSSPQSSTMSHEPLTVNNVYTLKANGSILVFEGFLKVNPFGLEDRKVPDFGVGEELTQQEITPEKHTTTPPPRYNDASLIKSLEEAGVGRPSTYATIISTIEARQYIEREQKKFIPTSVGMAVNDFLVKNFSDIDDIPFTAEMEDTLDKVANGEQKWEPMMQEFYTPFEKKLEIVKSAARVEIPAEETGEMCPKDGAPLVVRVGKFGKFISCKNFPTCDFKKQYVEETNYTCPKDGGKVIVKKTKKGRPFYGCSNYPACTYAAWKLEDVKKDMVEAQKSSKQ